MKFAQKLGLLVGLALTLAALGCGDHDPLSSVEQEDPAGKLAVSANRAGGVADRFGAHRSDSEVARSWFNLANRLFAAERSTPPVASRALGYAGVALYEAVAPSMPGYHSLAGQLNQLQDLPQIQTLNHHWPAVANAALATVWRGLFAGGTSASLAAIDSLEAALAGEHRSEATPETLEGSAAWGQQVGETILAWAAGDGYAELHNCSYTAPTGSPEWWVPTPPAFATAPQEPCWGDMRTFVLADGSACSPGPPLTYSEDSSSLFYLDAKEVYDTVNTLTDEQKAIAQFWADGGGTLTPPGHSVAILTQVLGQRDAGLGVAAEAYAKLGMAVADAFIACWWNKYEYNLLRPVSYIQKVINPTWTSFIVTPPFPEYTSGHSSQSGAADAVLTDLFGNVAFTDHTHAARNLPARSFTSFSAAAEEAALSRLYGGIHYRTANERGLESGRCIGNMVNDLTFHR